MSKNKKTVFINGALGKMGQSVISACKSNSDLEVKYAVDVPVHPYLDDSIYSEKDMKKYKLKDIKYSKAPSKLDVDLIIDFSSPKSSISLAKKAEGFRVPFVTGTTGFNSRQINELKKINYNGVLCIEYEAQVFGWELSEDEILKTNYQFVKDLIK